MSAAYAALFTDDNLDVLKTAAKLALLYGYGGALSTDFVDAANEFNAAYLGVSGSYTNEELAVMIVSNIMPDYIGEIYAEKYFSEEAKQNVEQMVQDIISAYEERIRSLDWMSPETKQKALRKLETMTVKIGYPDSFDTYLDDVDIRSAAEGGSYFLNMVEIAKSVAQGLFGMPGTAGGQNSLAHVSVHGQCLLQCHLQRYYLPGSDSAVPDVRCERLL